MIITGIHAVHTLQAFLIDRLREEGFKGWTFPLILVPIGGTLIEKSGYKEFLTLKKLPQEAIDAIVAGWRLSIKFSHEIYPKLLSGIKNTLTRKIIIKLAKEAINAMTEWIESIKKDPEIIERVYSKINIRTFRGFVKTLLTRQVQVTIRPISHQ